jgi:hypothetical protein
MAAENLGELTIDQLKKKEKEANRVIIALSIIFLICFTGLIIIRPVLTGAIIPLLAPVLITFRSRKKIREELKKRESKV